ncbi:regulatory protein, IclR [Pseudovibrio sp. FO-BEG1]|uniref:IclR family transcriptional regulator n=1 Tax=Pseudovibrio sp. (strain FO-BEG1) TaxID=911045 RepID=UPI000238BD8E|nr:IclR family transcriptional regulator [Pseudovibrio sp. FO-BEG1]AEV36466.1 regulatory protein, IclR [Pseudovibrio sp. FO-BEG1]
MRLLQSLSRGLQTLDYLVEQAKPLRLTDIASYLGVDKSNATHILRTLVACGYATQGTDRRYAASEKMTSSQGSGPTAEAIVATRQQWQPVLKQLTRETGECSHMAVLASSQVWYVDKIDSELPLKVDHPIGSLGPLHCTALGKAFLAFGDAEAEQELKQFTPATLTDHKALAAEISKSRDRGYAIDDEEFTSGIRCVAGPVFDEHGVMIAAIGVSGPTVRINDKRFEELGALVEKMCFMRE